jgi:F-type H+-transporting ATPase subunit epsilon
MATLFPLEVYTPQRMFFSESVEALVVTLTDGEVAVYANHVPFTAPVVPCLLKIKTKNGDWKTAFCAEGILEVKSRKTILISDAAEWPEEIDYERAKTAKEQAEKTLEDGTFKFQRENYNAALRRANLRLKAAAPQEKS